METFADKKLETKDMIALRIRASSIPSENLPGNYAEVVSELFPEFNKQKVRNVKNAIAVEEKVTEILESMSIKFVKLKIELKDEFENKGSTTAA